MDTWEIVVALIGAFSIPSAITGFLIHRIEKKMEKQEKERERREADQEEYRTILLKGVVAVNTLSRATAIAVQRIPDAKCNGDMKAALKSTEEAEEELQNFCIRSTAKNIF